jgi:hypothetical protein
VSGALKVTAETDDGSGHRRDDRAAGTRHARSYTRRILGGEEAEGGEERAVAPERSAPPRLRRRPLGYKRADVDEALGARDAELAELRQDVAALWLAFAQHDRILRSLTGESPPPAPPAARAPAEGDAPSAGPARLRSEAASIGDQLSELGDVLAAIEMATQTLERTYSEEIDEAPEPAPPPEDATEPEGEEQPEGDERPEA